MNHEICSGKRNRLKSCLTPDDGFMAAVAIDQGSSLQDLLLQSQKTKGSPDKPDLETFKTTLTEHFSRHTSAMLFDFRYGDACQKIADPESGVIRAYETDVYATGSLDRLTAIPHNQSVIRLKEKRANAIKLYLYYDPDDSSDVNDQKHALVEKVGAECYAHQMPFLFEPLTYRRDTDPAGESYVKIKPDLVARAMKEFSKKRYLVDILKVELPVNIKTVEGFASDGSSALFTHEDALNHFRTCADSTHLPFIYLSGGVTFDEFKGSLKLANQAEVSYAGFLCGRAIWHDAIEQYANFGSVGLEQWALETGVPRLNELKAIAEGHAKIDLDAISSA